VGRVTYLVECFWPDIRDSDVDLVGTRALTAARELSRGGQPVRFVGSILMPDDEVLLCEFEGLESAVRRAAEQAEIPFARIVRAVDHRGQS
jgi:hypothetical protein